MTGRLHLHSTVSLAALGFTSSHLFTSPAKALQLSLQRPPLPLTWPPQEEPSHLGRIFVSLVPGTTTLGVSEHRGKGMWMEQTSTDRRSEAHTLNGRPWAIVSPALPESSLRSTLQSRECLLLCTPPPQSSDMHLLSLTVTLPYNTPSPELWPLYERTGKNSRGGFALSFWLSLEIDVYLNDPTWIWCPDFSHRSQIILLWKSHTISAQKRGKPS